VTNYATTHDDTDDDAPPRRGCHYCADPKVCPVPDPFTGERVCAQCLTLGDR
jgi:hypothetical protein